MVKWATILLLAIVVDNSFRQSTPCDVQFVSVCCHFFVTNMHLNSNAMFYTKIDLTQTSFLVCTLY